MFGPWKLSLSLSLSISLSLSLPLSLSLSSHLDKCGRTVSAGANARRLMNAEPSATNHAAASANARPDLARILIFTGARLRD